MLVGLDAARPVVRGVAADEGELAVGVGELGVAAEDFVGVYWDWLGVFEGLGGDAGDVEGGG